MELQRLSIDEVWQKGQEESQSIIGLGIFSPTKYMNRIYGEYVKSQNEIEKLTIEVEVLREFKRKHDEQLEKCYGKSK
jgi:hypothetical protein